MVLTLKQAFTVIPFRKANSLNDATALRINIIYYTIGIICRGFAIQIHIPQWSYTSEIAFLYFIYNAIVETRS